MSNEITTLHDHRSLCPTLLKTIGQLLSATNESIYTVNIRPNGDVVPIGIPHCRGCGNSVFTVFGKHGEEIVPTDE